MAEHVIIYVRGGVAEWTATPGVVVDLIDWDNAAVGGCPSCGQDQDIENLGSDCHECPCGFAWTDGQARGR